MNLNDQALDLKVKAEASESHCAQLLEQILMSDPMMSELLFTTIELGVKNACIGAGCVVQTIWNKLYDKPTGFGIQDIDWVYFDDQNLLEENEQLFENDLNNKFSHWAVGFDVKNQARVHEWYAQKFDHRIQPYRSIFDAIDSWPTTATAIGVWLDEKGCFSYYAPFGLTDLFSGIVRPNRKQITQKIYDKKAERWQSLWPSLTVIPWGQYVLSSAKPEDAGLIFELKEKTMKPYIEELWGWNDNDQRLRFHQEYNPESNWLINWHQGFAGILELNEDNRSIHVVEFEILPELQGKGLGRAVMQDLIYRSKTTGKILELGCFKNNPKAYHFYLSLGFVVVNETQTHFLMQASQN